MFLSSWAVHWEFSLWLSANKLKPKEFKYIYLLPTSNLLLWLNITLNILFSASFSMHFKFLWSYAMNCIFFQVLRIILRTLHNWMCLGDSSISWTTKWQFQSKYYVFMEVQILFYECITLSLHWGAKLHFGIVKEK